MDTSEAPTPSSLSKAERRRQRKAEQVQSRTDEARRSQPKRIEARTLRQAQLIEALGRAAPVIFALGPAGTGKTFVSVRYAQNMLLARRTSGISLSRVTVSDPRHRMGFLPGGDRQKIGPWMVPMIDALEFGASKALIQKQMDEKVITFEPFEHMRGKTFYNRWVILDEAQNCTVQDLELIITRLGEDSRLIVCGDQFQMDDPRTSGLLKVVDMVGRHGLDAEIIRFHEEDAIARSKANRDWVMAFNRDKREAAEQASGNFHGLNTPEFLRARG